MTRISEANIVDDRCPICDEYESECLCAETPVLDTAASNLRNALQVVTGVVEDELRTIGYKVDGQSCYAITVEELEGIRNRITRALQDLERDTNERAGVLRDLMERA